MSAFKSKKWMWRDGFSYSKNPEVVGKVLTKIEERDGEITAKSFLEESRSETSETHDMFEWNDSIAAEKYRLRQAGNIIGLITYEIVSSEEKVTQVELVKGEPGQGMQVRSYSGFVNVSSAGRGRVNSPASFISTDIALSNADTRKQVLKNALGEIDMYTNKYRQYEELSKIFIAIDETRKEITD